MKKKKKQQQYFKCFIVFTYVQIKMMLQSQFVYLLAMTMIFNITQH